MRPSALRALWCCLPFCLLAAVAGCKPATQPPPYTSVSGKVLYRGQPLPGGRITFVTVQGGFPSNANIREDGTYKINAPTGDVLITVDNSMLQPRRGTPAQPPQSPEMLKHSVGDPDPVKGQYVEIPAKYKLAETSGLKYTVQAGEQTHDVTLD